MDSQTVTSSSPESESNIRDFLTSHHSGVLATADATGTPHAATIYFTVDDSFCLLFATKTETKKYKNIKENKKVSLACFDEASLTAVQLHGHVIEIDDPTQRQITLNKMYLFAGKNNTELPPIEKVFAGDYITLKIIPRFIKMGIFARPDAESNEEIYETLEFSAK